MIYRALSLTLYVNVFVLYERCLVLVWIFFSLCFLPSQFLLILLLMLAFFPFTTLYDGMIFLLCASRLSMDNLIMI